MKLSAHDKQRLRRSVAMLVGLAAVLYAYVHLLILPLVQIRVQGDNALAELRAKTDGAMADLREAEALGREYAALRTELEVATNRFVVRPVLGSLLMSVQSALDPIARQCGLQIDPCVERGRIEIPKGSRKDGSLVFDRYAMELTMNGTYQAVSEFLAAVEGTNAYVCVTDLDIQGRVEDPALHKVTVRLEWPVFGERRSTDKEGAAGKPAVARTGVSP